MALSYGEDRISGGAQPIPVDRGGRYVPIIEAEHTRIHESVAYTYSSKQTVLNGASLDFLVVVAAGSYPHLRKYTFVSSGAPCDIFLYEGTTVSANGTIQTASNGNRNSSNTSDISVYLTPTVTGVGTQIHYDLLGGTKQSGGSAETLPVEWILKPATNYLLRVTNNSGSTVTIGTNFFWYDTN